MRSVCHSTTFRVLERGTLAVEIVRPEAVSRLNHWGTFGIFAKPDRRPTGRTMAAGRSGKESRSGKNLPMGRPAHRAGESTKIRGVCNIRSSESMVTFARPKRAVAKTPMFLKSSKRVQPSSGSYNQQVKCPPPGF